MTQRFEIRLANAVKLSLAASIVLVTLALGHLAYRDLQDVILAGFDRKLRAIATATGSFIDGDAHRRLERPTGVLGLTADPGRGAPIAFDTLGSRMVELDVDSGLAEPIVPLMLDEVAGLAFDTRRGHPVVLGASGWLLRVDFSQARTHPIGAIGRDDCLGLVYERSADAFYCAAGTTLVRLDPATADAEEVAELDGLFRWLAPGPPGQLWGFDVESRQVRAIPLPADDAEEPAPPATAFDLDPDILTHGVHGLASGPGGAPIWLATDRLLRLDEDGVTSLGLNGFRSEQSPDYQRWIGPMRRIRETTGITFLYTQVPHADPGRCIYILDAGLGDERAVLGDEDDLEEESILGQRQALNQGEVFLSSVRPWKQWGLLKVAFAPILDRLGESSALAGADVTITVIREKTRASLLRVLATGALSLVIGLLVAASAARRITGPVAEVKEAALALAAGRFDQGVERGHLVELRRLSSALDTVGGTLEHTIAHLDLGHERLEHRRRLREMRDDLGHRLERGADGAALAWRCRDADAAYSTSGVVVGEAGTLAWLSPPAADAAEAMRRRSTVQRVLTSLVTTPVAPDGTPWTQSSRPFPHWIEGFVFLPRVGDRVAWCLRRPLMVVRSTEGEPELVDGTGTADLGRDSWLLFAPREAADSIAPRSADAPPPDLDQWLAGLPAAPAGLYLLVSPGHAGSDV